MYKIQSYVKIGVVRNDVTVEREDEDAIDALNFHVFPPWAVHLCHFCYNVACYRYCRTYCYC